MIDFFIKQWEKNKDKLRDYFKNNTVDKYDEYKKLVKLVLNIIINNDNDVYGEKIDVSQLKEIDFGDYQGTLIYIFPADTYQPSANETFYMTVDYGSCSGCDTLMGIIDIFQDGTPSDKQVDELMTLCLHLVQNAHRFKDWEWQYD